MKNLPVCRVSNYNSVRSGSVRQCEHWNSTIEYICIRPRTASPSSILKSGQIHVGAPSRLNQDFGPMAAAIYLLSPLAGFSYTYPSHRLRVLKIDTLYATSPPALHLRFRVDGLLRTVRVFWPGFNRISHTPRSRASNNFLPFLVAVSPIVDWLVLM